MQHIPFVKMHASGNDFIVMDNRMGQAPADIQGFVKRLCRRNFSVGADGLVLIEESRDADFRWRFYNSDGSVAEMCGNASRCAARFAYLRGIADRKLAFETLAGVIKAEVKKDTVKVQLTSPTRYTPDVKINLHGTEREGSFINTGVPHMVYFVDDIEAVDVMKDGAATRYNEIFGPAGTNANFVHVLDRGRLAIRTYERGVEGETLACGTGAVAAALIAGARGICDQPVSLTTRGGNVLTVYFDWDGKTFKDVYLEGDAVLVFQGTLEEGALL